MTVQNADRHMDNKKYESVLKAEKKIFDRELYNHDSLIESVGDGLDHVLTAFQKRVEDKTGANVWDHVTSSINDHPAPRTRDLRILSLGSGPGGAEIQIARNVTRRFQMHCIDINKKSLEMGQARADQEKMNIKFIEQDINSIQLTQKYDVIFAHAALHHFVELEYIFEQIDNSMDDSSVFFVYDVIVKNRNEMWNDTKEAFDKIMDMLPEKYSKAKRHIIHTIKKQISDSHIIDHDGFECIRSQDVLPLLKKKFATVMEVPGFCLARRFVDHPYQDNYDASNPFDVSVLDTIIKLDEEYAKKYGLKPESVFLKLAKRIPMR